MVIDEMCRSGAVIVEKMYTLPFLRELQEGTLKKDIFMFYLVQDALYLSEFTRALLIAASRLSDNLHMQHLIGFAQQAIDAERDLHLKYFQTDISSENRLVEPSPACFMYTHYLLKKASIDPIEESVASLLPCFWVYQQVGRHLVSLRDRPHNPYLQWIHFYAGETFGISVDRAIDITNQIGADVSSSRRRKMVRAFVRSTQLEWLFWDSAYRQETWNMG